MGEKTSIGWTDSTFNPWIGCTNVSPGCDHCYAEALSARFKLTEWGPPARLSAATPRQARESEGHVDRSQPPLPLMEIQASSVAT
jgi:protein gp37